MTPRRRWSALAVAAVVLAIAAPAQARPDIAARAAHAPALKCTHVLKAATITDEVRTETGIQPDLAPVSQDTNQPFRYLPTMTFCLAGWAGDRGNASAYGYSAGLEPQPVLWWTAGGVTTQEFKRLYRDEDGATADLPEIGTTFAKQKLDLHVRGAHAFLGTIDVSRYETTPDHPLDYGLFVLGPSRHGKPGDLLVLWAWPMSLAGEEAIAKDLLAHKKI